MKKILTTLGIALLFASSAQAQDYECRIDTILYYNYATGTSVKNLTQRVIKSFDTSDNQTQQLFEIWNSSTNSWENYSKFTLVYNGFVKPKESLIEFWNSNINAWENNSKSIYTLDASNNYTGQVSQNWNSNNNTWENSNKYNWTYNASNIRTEEIRQIWINASNTWENFNKQNSVFDNSGNSVENLRQNWNNTTNVWENFSKSNSIYDAFGNNIESISQTWNGAWINSSKVNRTYNLSNQILEQLYQLPDGIGWRNIYRYNWTYNSFGNLAEKIDVRWINNTWVNDEKTSWAYDASNNNTEELVLDWNSMNATWVNDSKISYEYDLNNNLITKESFSTWNIAANYYEDRTREEYKCKLIEILSVNEMEVQKPLFQVYPNPVLLGAEIKINTLEQETLQIFDFTGKSIYETKLQVGLNTINTQDIPTITKGIYFLRTNSQSSKLILN